MTNIEAIMNYFQIQPHKNNLQTYPPASKDIVGHNFRHSHTRAMGAAQKWIRVAGQTGNSLEICRNSLRIVWKFAEMVWEWLGEWPQDFLSQPPFFGLYFLYLGGVKLFRNYFDEISNYLKTISMKFQTIWKTRFRPC